MTQLNQTIDDTYLPTDLSFVPAPAQRVGRLKTLVRNGQDSTGLQLSENNYSLTVNILDRCSVSQLTTGWTGHCESWINPNEIMFSIPWSSRSDTELLSTLISNIKGHDFNMATTLGEARESLIMIGDSARSLGKAFVAVRKGRFLDAARYLGLEKPPKGLVASKTGKVVFGNWLAYQYGWNPLLGDVKNAAEAVAKHFGNVTPKTSFRARGKAKSSTIRFGTQGVSFIEERLYRKQIIARFSDSQPLSNGAELGLIDPFSLAWELLPYSFVVDWFLPIGDFLSNAAALRSLKPGIFITTVNHRRTGKVVDNAGHTFNGKCGFENFSLTRTVSNSLSNPLPIPNVKQLKDAFSFKHAVSGIALLASRIK